MNPTHTAYDNLLEPAGVPGLFLRHPPQGFATGTLAGGVPFFRTEFDLLTTCEKNTVLRVQALPLFRHWSTLLRFPACFMGTTVTEYALLPENVVPTAVLAELRGVAKPDSLVIIKDMPVDSPLLSVAENNAAAAFCREASSMGFLELEGQALAYVPVDFTGIDEFLRRLSPARRKDLRRKLKLWNTLDIEAVPLGDAMFFRRDVLDVFYAAYREVFDQSHIHFDVLTRDFFADLLQKGDMDGVVFCYRRNGSLIGYNICLINEGRLIDKYIGFHYPEARKANLYFISWFQNLRYALERGLHTYVAGWTDPEVKAALGAKFTFTRHLVWIRNPVLRKLLSPFKQFFEGDRRALEAIS